MQNVCPRLTAVKKQRVRRLGPGLALGQIAQPGVHLSSGSATRFAISSAAEKVGSVGLKGTARGSCKEPMQGTQMISELT
jgi:hypothetical protein